MPSEHEIKAAAKVLTKFRDLSDIYLAEAALTAAERVRDEALRQRMVARTPNIHTCHADCPCQSGGEPMPDFIEDSG